MLESDSQVFKNISYESKLIHKNECKLKLLYTNLQKAIDIRLLIKNFTLLSRLEHLTFRNILFFEFQSINQKYFQLNYFSYLECT